jgi:hypothetical protein
MDTVQVLAQHLYQEDLYNIPGRVLVVLPNSWESISEADRNVLIRMVNAVRLNFAAISVIERTSLSTQDIQTLAPEKILSFGVPLSPMPALYTLSSMNDIPLIAADRLEHLDDAKKKILWGVLKQMFAL